MMIAVMMRIVTVMTTITNRRNRQQMKNGFLVSFEGGEACGKSTQIKRFKEYLDNRGIDNLFTREPGGTELGENIRNILLHFGGKMTTEAEFLLFSASRAQIVGDVIKPNLADGKVVVMDRYYDSSYAYQGYAGKIDLNDLRNITNFAIKGAVPDITFLLDISYEEGMKRKAKDENLKNLDRMESKGKDYHDRVRKGYLEMAKAEPDRFVVINAMQTPDEITNEIAQIFEERYQKILQK